MNRETVKNIRIAMEIALGAVENEFGVFVKVGRASFTDSNCNFKVEIADIDSESGEVLSKEAEDFKLRAHQYGLKADDLGREFSFGGDTFKITGLAPRRPKYPVIGMNVDNGKPYKFGADLVVNALRKVS
jgi:hypothetical protein